MKKGKVFSKRHIVLASMVLCLAAAVWLNMKYSSFDNLKSDIGNFGSGNYLNDDKNLGEAIETGANTDFLSSSKLDRDKKRTELIDDLTKKINDSSLDENLKKQALSELTKVADNATKESSLETVLKAKGFTNCLAIISSESVSIIVKKDKLLQSETLQIQDAVRSQTDIDLEKIKIITVK